ncbi:MAG: hypothetical protein JNN27_09650 [Planctomycetes bacterium]|nr:hypothetical protein [Planctomycetota bacterium]
MSPTVRNVLAVLAGVIVGVLVNAAFVATCSRLIPPPAGVDMNDAESVAQSMHLFEPKHFVLPFLAHALGTLSGALAAHVIAATGKSKVAYIAGAVFLCGGIAACVMIPAPAWFIAIDLVVAYIPMAWLATRLAGKLKA